MCTLNWRRIPSPPQPEKFGAAASRILVGAPAGFGPRQPENCSAEGSIGEVRRYILHISNVRCGVKIPQEDGSISNELTSRVNISDPRLTSISVSKSPQRRGLGTVTSASKLWPWPWPRHFAVSSYGSL